MESECGAPYYEAEVAGNPNRRIDGTVIVKVQFCEGEQRRTVARFFSNHAKAMELKVGDIIRVCPYDGDAYIEEKTKSNKKK